MVIGTEVLEHLSDDTGVLEIVRPGTTVILSVPTFLCEDHVRSFADTEAVHDRYESLLAGLTVEQIQRRYFVGAGVRRSGL